MPQRIRFHSVYDQALDYLKEGELLLGVSTVPFRGMAVQMTAPSDEQVVRELVATISKVLHGTNLYDAQRALCAVMSCGICTSSKST